MSTPELRATDDDTPDTPERDVKMTIWEHLDEFRKRLVRAGLALLVGAGGCWIYREKLLAWLMRPYEKAWIARSLPGTPELQTLSPTDPFVGYMQLSMVGGVILATPIIFYQLWSFISPGLYARWTTKAVSRSTFIGSAL